MALTQQQKDDWREKGYLVVEALLSADELARLRDSVAALEAKAAGLSESTDRFRLKAFESGGRMVQQISEPHQLGGAWLDTATHRRLLDSVEDLLGPNIQLYYSMLMMKPPREGFSAPWHQDMAFFPHDRTDLLACQVYIDDSTMENGCIHVVPGSHKLGLLNHYKDGRFSGIVQGDVSGFDAQQVAAPVKAGGALFWHALTLHSSKANTSDKPRRALVLEYKDPQARLMGGVFNFARLETRPVGLMVRGRDPHGDLLSAV
jgi:phytanoyl-CoA hydroxylase